MLRPVGLIRAHMECRALHETVAVLTELLAFETVTQRSGEVTVRHPNTEWLLVVHEGGPEAQAKQMHNHFGVRVASRREVDAAYEYLKHRKERYGLRHIGKPLYNHGSYSLYFIEPGTNGWEIECYKDVLRKESGWQRNGSVYAPHWTTPLSEERFSGRGYVPQAFTHGTLACGDLDISRSFYAEVLGLDIHRANDHVIYLKHPADKWYIVAAVRERWQNCSPNFRFTLALESSSAVCEARRWLAGAGEKVGVKCLGELQASGPSAFFFLADPDGNWWEISSPDGSR